MDKNEYMKQMRHHLRRLPKEDFDRAMEYFEEYFEEAGPEQEQQAIGDLGTPEAAAGQIVRDLAVENAGKSNRSVKRGASAVWIGILAVFAAPIGLPLALAGGILALSFVLVICALFAAFFITAFAMTASVIPLLGGSIWLLFTAPVDGLTNIGLSLIAVGVGIWVVKGCIWLMRCFLNLMTRLLGSIAGKGKRHEK